MMTRIKDIGILIEQTKEIRYLTWLPQFTKALESISSTLLDKQTMEFCAQLSALAIDILKPLTQSAVETYRDDLLYHANLMLNQFGETLNKQSSKELDELVRSLKT